ncbi:MAG: metal ABC transporter permease [Syntrophales bacterium]|nr:metal ABC transporter permease [Syntrophales bacterium]MDD5640820.1 metal ABC transporter permease [Syntrophales bacterium]
MTELLSMGFLQRALLAGIMVSLLCGVLSVFVILRRMAFIGVGVSHSAFGGVALGFLLAVDPLWTGIGFAVLVALAIEWVQTHSRVEEDTAIGIFFAASMALGLVFLHLSRTYNVDVFGFLFGNILAIGQKQLVEILVVATVVLAVTLAFYKELVFLSFDEEMAWVSGVPVRALRYLFLVMLALVIITSIYLVGIILVAALLVIPGATAQNLTGHIRGMIITSAGVAVGGAVGGISLSCLLDFPTGATIVLLLSLVYLATIMVPRLHSHK